MMTQDQIAQARAGIIPEGIALAVTGTEDGAEQALYREGDEIVCYKQTFIFATREMRREVTRRTPVSPAIAEKLCASVLARNNIGA